MRSVEVEGDTGRDSWNEIDATEKEARKGFSVKCDEQAKGKKRAGKINKKKNHHST